MTGDGIVAHPRFVLPGGRQFQSHLAAAMPLCESAGENMRDRLLLTVVPDPGNSGGWMFLMPDGAAIGRISGRSRIAVALAEGHEIARAELVSIQHNEGDGKYSAKVNVWTGPPGSVYTPAIRSEPRYFAPVVGEQYHAAAVARCRAGEPVHLAHERGNPHDPHALAVISIRGEMLGYIPRDHWLQRAVLKDGHGCTAAIHDIVSGQRGFLQIVLRVQLCAAPPGEVSYDRQNHAADETAKQADVVAAYRFGALLMVAILVVLAVAIAVSRSPPSS